MTNPLDWLDNVEPQPASEPVTPNHRVPTDEPKPGLFTRRPRMSDRSTPRPQRTPRPRKPAPPYEPGKIREAVIELYSGAAFFVMPFKPTVAMTMMGPVREATEEEPNPPSVIERCAEAWEAAAKQYDWVRALFESGTNWTVIIGLCVAHAPILFAMFESTPAAAMEAMLRRMNKDTEPAE